MEGREILTVKDLTVRFGRFTALDRVSLAIQKGEIHGVVGENGAGKSTLMKCLYGALRPFSGSITLRGAPVSFRSPHEAMRAGIGMVYQHFTLVPSMSVACNVVLGREEGFLGFFNRSGAEKAVSELSKRWDLELDPRIPVRDLPVGLQQRVEILKVLYRDAEILIFDEPTAVLPPQEVEGLFSILRAFRDQGRTVLFVAHDLKEVLSLCDRVTVLRQGKNTACRKAKNLSPYTLAELMIGRPLEPLAPETGLPAGEVRLEAKDLCLRRGRQPVLEHCSFQVRSGEILGIAGIAGNGQSELEEVLCGLIRPDSGIVMFEGQDVTDLPVSDRRNRSMAWIPEDRLRTALAPLGDLKDNALMGFQRRKAFCRRGMLRLQAIRDFAAALMECWGVSAAGVNVQAGTLSGGNMQRFVLGRELEQSPRILIASQPTRGVDIGGSQFIRGQLQRLRDQGTAILLISSNLDEILELSNHVAVMFRGRLAAVLPRSRTTRDRVGRLMLQGSEEEAE